MNELFQALNFYGPLYSHQAERENADCSGILGERRTRRKRSEKVILTSFLSIIRCSSIFNIQPMAIRFNLSVLEYKSI